MDNRILVVDDEPRQVEIVRTILEREGFDVQTAHSAETALVLMNEAPPHVLLTDLRLPAKDGISLLEAATRLDPPTTTILMTAHGTIDNAVEAMKKGAFDYLTKPLDRASLVLAVRRALDKARLSRENAALRRQLVDRFSLPNLVGDSGPMQDVFRIVAKVAPSASTVLITGESGTGKELIARALHYGTPRAAREFAAVNCAALPEPLLESELFGHEKGAFTGADARKVGLFEHASGSTLFLDEVGDMALLTQAKLLRALQEREIRRLGSNVAVPVDVRIVAASNRDLPKLIAEGRFREDLYYRLNVVTLALPPLRARKTDIPQLAAHFLARQVRAAGGGTTPADASGTAAAPRVAGFDDAALAALMAYHWPGNVRQLESAIERAVLLAEGPRIGLADLPQEVRQAPPEIEAFRLPRTGVSLEAVERSLLEQALQRAGTVSGAARLLGLTRRTMQYRMEKFDLPSPAPDGAPPVPDGEPERPPDV